MTDALRYITSLLIALILASGGAIGTPAQAVQGPANWAGASHGPAYLAMRLPRSSVVDIEGPGGKWLGAVVNDYGPSKAGGKVADIALVRWLDICGVPASRGTCHVVITIRKRGGDGPAPTLPPTDTQ